MSYFDQASLVMIPSGYKTSKVYSIKPTDGSGDMSFSRSNDTATRVNSAGLIEKVRTNVALYSEQFDNAYWGKANVTVTANTTVNPVNGATTADTLTRTGGASGFLNRQIAQTGIVTFSIFAKAGTTNQVRLNIYDGSTDRGATYNLTTGAISSVYGSPLFTTAQSFGSGWYRISISVNAASYTDCQVQVDSVNSVIIFGAQLETGDIATDYIATTSAAVSVGPVANVPRLDYLNSSCPRLLLEPQRTNLLTFSENFSQWLNAGGTTTANTAVSPSGYQDADTLTGVRYQATFASNTYTLSAFAKKVDGDNTFALRFDVPTTKVAVFNLNNGTIVGTDAGYTSTITAYGNGWYRCTLTTPASTTISNAVLVSANSGVSSTYVWGAQLEAGAYATSYIPTLGSASTRAADACSKTGISSLTSASEYTIYWEGTHIPTGQYNSFATFYNNANNNDSTRFYRNNTNNEIRAAFFNSATGLALDLASGVTTQTAKCAVRVKAGSYALYVNGALVNSSTSSLAPASNIDAVNLQYFSSGQSFDQKTGQVLFFKTALSNADLAALTA